MVQQISIFVENKLGRVAEITETLAEQKVDIRAISISDTSDFGILRIIVDRPAEAAAFLKEAGYTVSLTDVIAVWIQDTPGEFAKAMRILADAGVAVEYMYAFVSREYGKASVILRVSDPEKASQVLEGSGVEILEPQAIYEM